LECALLEERGHILPAVLTPSSPALHNPGGLRERNHSEDPDIDGSIILRWIFRKWDVEAWTILVWLRIGTGGGYL
jgi:hypothetical protein